MRRALVAALAGGALLACGGRSAHLVVHVPTETLYTSFPDEEAACASYCERLSDGVRYGRVQSCSFAKLLVASTPEQAVAVCRLEQLAE